MMGFLIILWAVSTLVSQAYSANSPIYTPVPSSNITPLSTKTFLPAGAIPAAGSGSLALSGGRSHGSPARAEAGANDRIVGN